MLALAAPKPLTLRATFVRRGTHGVELPLADPLGYPLRGKAVPGDLDEMPVVILALVAVPTGNDDAVIVAKLGDGFVEPV